MKIRLQIDGGIATKTFYHKVENQGWVMGIEPTAPRATT